MTKETIYEIFADIDENYVEEAVRPAAKWKRAGRVRKWGAVAACLCLTLGTITVCAATGWGTKLADLFTARTYLGTDYKESGYDLSVDIEKIPMEAFTGDIHEVSDVIMKQYKDYQPHLSWYPGSWEGKFASAAAAREYIGFTSLKGLDWNLEEQSTALRVMGRENGELTDMELETDYEVGDIRLQAFSKIYTEYYGDVITIGTRTTEDVEFTEKYFTTDSQLQCHVLTSTAMESGYLTMEGYLVEDGVLYSLNIAYLEADAGQAEELLHQWANLF